MTRWALITREGRRPHRTPTATAPHTLPSARRERDAWLRFGIVDDTWRALGLGRQLFEGFGFVPVKRLDRLYKGERDA